MVKKAAWKAYHQKKKNQNKTKQNKNKTKKEPEGFLLHVSFIYIIYRCPLPLPFLISVKFNLGCTHLKFSSLDDY